MQFSRDARPLADALFQAHIELPRQLLQPQLIERSEQCQKGGHARQAEPRGLVVRRSYGKIKERAGLVPYATVIASAHAEPVVAGREIRIERLPASANILPALIHPFQLVAKTNLFR